MTTGHDLRRVDEPVPEWEALLTVIVQAVILVRHADSGTARPGDVDRLRAAVQRAGIDHGRGVMDDFPGLPQPQRVWVDEGLRRQWLFHRRYAAGSFVIAQVNAVMTGGFQIAYPHRSLGMFFLALVGSTALPLTLAALSLRKADGLARRGLRRQTEGMEA